MAKYNITIFQRILSAIIVFLSISIIGLLWLNQHHPLDNKISQSVAIASSSETQKSLAQEGTAPKNSNPTVVKNTSQQSVNFDFYNLLSQSNTSDHSNTNTNSTSNEANVSNSNSEVNGSDSSINSNPSSNSNTTLNKTQMANNSSTLTSPTNIGTTHTNSNTVNIKSAQPSQIPPITGQSSTGTFYLQIAALHDAVSAVAFKEKLDTLDYPTSIQTYQQDQQLWYRIIVGPYSSKDVAAAVQQQLHQQRLNSFLVAVTK